MFDELTDTEINLLFDSEDSWFIDQDEEEIQATNEEAGFTQLII